MAMMERDVLGLGCPLLQTLTEGHVLVCTDVFQLWDSLLAFKVYA